jgi:hypothetical protein
LPTQSDRYSGLQKDSGKRYLNLVNGKHRATLQAIWERPTRADIRWTDIESLVVACGGEVREREGSRVAVILNGVRAVFRRPYPKPVGKKGAIDGVRLFFGNTGIRP